MVASFCSHEALAIGQNASLTSPRASFVASITASLSGPNAFRAAAEIRRTRHGSQGLRRLRESGPLLAHLGRLCSDRVRRYLDAVDLVVRQLIANRQIRVENDLQITRALGPDAHDNPEHCEQH